MNCFLCWGGEHTTVGAMWAQVVCEVYANFADCTIHCFCIMRLLQFRVPLSCQNIFNLFTTILTPVRDQGLTGLYIISDISVTCDSLTHHISFGHFFEYSFWLGYVMSLVLHVHLYPYMLLLLVLSSVDLPFWLLLPTAFQSKYWSKCDNYES